MASKPRSERSRAKGESVINHQRLAALSRRAEDILALVERTLDDDQAENVTVIDLAGKADFADYMVIASGSSGRKLGAMATHLQENLKAFGLSNLAIEGRSGSDWVLLDAGDVIVHLFRPATRAYYDLEKLWEPDLAGPSHEEPATV